MANEPDKKFPNVQMMMTVGTKKTRSLQVKPMNRRRRMRLLQYCWKPMHQLHQARHQPS